MGNRFQYMLHQKRPINGEKGTRKDNSTSLVIKEMQIETVMLYHHTATRMTKMKRLVLPNTGENVEQLGLSYSAQWYNHFGKQFLSFLRVKHILNI